MFWPKFHSFTRSGWVVNRSLIPSAAVFPVQTGQRVPRVRLATGDCHSYPHCVHFHHRRLLELYGIYSVNCPKLYGHHKKRLRM